MHFVACRSKQSTVPSEVWVGEGRGPGRGLGMASGVVRNLQKQHWSLCWWNYQFSIHYFVIWVCAYCCIYLRKCRQFEVLDKRSKSPGVYAFQFTLPLSTQGATDSISGWFWHRNECLLIRYISCDVTILPPRSFMEVMNEHLFPCNSHSIKIILTQVAKNTSYSVR